MLGAEAGDFGVARLVWLFRWFLWFHGMSKHDGGCSFNDLSLVGLSHGRDDSEDALRD
jgi:hypothetical protein